MLGAPAGDGHAGRAAAPIGCGWRLAVPPEVPLLPAAHLPVLARVTLLARLAEWERLDEAERDEVRASEALLTAMASEGG